MIHGETVYVLWRRQVGTDDLEAPVYEEEPERVDDVVVTPGTALSLANDVIDSNRPEGAEVAYTLHFPKTYEGELAHQRISVRGDVCAVIGHPSRYTERNCPGKWNLPVYVTVNDG